MESKRLPLHHPLIKTTYIDKSTMVMIKSQDFGLMVYYKAKHKLSTKMAIISKEVSKKVTKFKDSWFLKTMVHIKVSSPINSSMEKVSSGSKIKLSAPLGQTVLSKEDV